MILRMYEHKVSASRGSIPLAPHTIPGETSRLRVPHAEYVRRIKYRMRATSSTQTAGAGLLFS